MINIQPLQNILNFQKRTCWKIQPLVQEQSEIGYGGKKYELLF